MLRALPKVRYWEMSGLSPNATRLLSLTQRGHKPLSAFSAARYHWRIKARGRNSA